MMLENWLYLDRRWFHSCSVCFKINAMQSWVMYKVERCDVLIMWYQDGDLMALATEIKVSRQQYSQQWTCQWQKCSPMYWDMQRGLQQTLVFIQEALKCWLSSCSGPGGGLSAGQTGLQRHLFLHSIFQPCHQWWLLHMQGLLTNRSHGSGNRELLFLWS